MADVNYYLDMLKDEVRKKVSKLDPTLSETGRLSLGELKRMAALMNSVLLENPLVIAKRQGRQIKTQYVAPSEITLRRYFVYEKPLKVPVDKRVLATLDLFAWFLKYKSWEDFVRRKQKQIGVVGRSLERTLIQVISNASQAEFRAYQKLPKIETEELKKYLVPNGPAYKRICGVLRRCQKRQWVITDPDNASHRDIYSIRLIHMDSKTAVFEVVAYWYLRWHETTTDTDPKIYNVANTQWMRLVNIDGTWKVATNFYQPLSDEHALKVIKSKKPIA